MGHPSNRTGYTDPEGGTISYVYDTLNRLTSLNSSLAGQFGYGYDELSRRTTLTRPNGVVTRYNYDSLSRLVDVLHKAGDTTVIDGASYTYDNAGNRVSKTNYLDNSAEQYVYDDIYQLTQVTRNSTVTEAYTYDKVGNRLSSLGVPTYSYNSSNQLTSSSDGVTYAYDDNGNTLTKADGSGLTQYGWDYENRLTSVTMPGGPVVTFKYDPFGRRIQKASAAGVTNYVYDEDNITEEVDAAGLVQARYAQGPGIDEPLAMVREGTTDFFAADGLGSVTSLTDASGTIGVSYTYETFGGLRSTTGTLANPVRYTGREYDAETGMYYYRARYYDPQAGRFLSEDSIGLDTESTNYYAYAENDPVDLVDPLGTRALPSAVEEGFEVIVGKGWAGKLLPKLLPILRYGGPLLAVDRKKPPEANANCPDCIKLMQEIKQAMGEVEARINDVLTDPRHLFELAYDTPNPAATGTSTTWEGHIQQLHGAQNRLRWKLIEAIRKNCPIPPGAWALALRGLPKRPRGH